MGDTATKEASQQRTSGRAWHRRSFYISDQMAGAAHELSEAEERRTGRQVGAGQIIDRAMRRYVSELLSPDELARLLNGNGASRD
jgi:hypothetical protein